MDTKYVTKPFDVLECKGGLYQLGYDVTRLIADKVPGIVRNDADLDALQFAVRNMIKDIQAGRITVETLGISGAYNEKGNIE